MNCNQSFGHWTAPQQEQTQQACLHGPHFGSVTNPPANLISTIPLQNSCSFCVENVAKYAAKTSIQIPVQVNLNSSSTLLVDASPTPYPTLYKPRNPLENEMLSPPSPPFRYLPPVKRTRIPKKLKEPPTNIAGLSKWFWKRRADQMRVTSISKNKLQRTQKTLKRLNNKLFRQHWKMEKKSNFSEQESIRESKREMLQRKGIKAPSKSECTLWNCPRKQYKRKRPFMPLDMSRRSASTLSNLSKRSRSPIKFRRSP